MRVLYRLRKCVSDYRRRIIPSHQDIVIKSAEEAELELVEDRSRIVRLIANSSTIEQDNTHDDDSNDRSHPTPEKGARSALSFKTRAENSGDD